MQYIGFFIVQVSFYIDKFTPLSQIVINIFRFMFHLFMPDRIKQEKRAMAPLIRFTMVEIYSTVSFTGKIKRTLKYPVCSISLIPKTKLPRSLPCPAIIPEIFWQ